MLCGLSGPAFAADSPSSPGSASWTVYHGDPAGTGVAASVTRVDTDGPAWTSPALDGQLYGEPLVYAGRVYVATENDTVYALTAATGKIAWSAHVGSPVPAGSLPCGDIRPVAGITGTPVIDPARNEIFVVADEMVGGIPAHRLMGLSTASGRVELSQDVDPPGAVPADLLQRTGLTLDAGQVVFGMGGNDGDCAVYRGRVAAVPETGGTPKFFTVDAAPGESQGAVWMGGAAPVVDTRGVDGEELRRPARLGEQPPAGPGRQAQSPSLPPLGTPPARASSVSPVRCSRSAGTAPGGSTSWLSSTRPEVVLRPISRWAGIPPTISSATTKISFLAGSITGVPVIPATGLMSPHGSEPAGTGLPTCADQAILPVAAVSAYTVSFSVAT